MNDCLAAASMNETEIPSTEYLTLAESFKQEMAEFTKLIEQLERRRNRLQQLLNRLLKS